jgi:hypothetical protein
MMLRQLLSVLAEKPPASAGYRGSDLVPWRDPDPPENKNEFRLSGDADEICSTRVPLTVTQSGLIRYDLTVWAGWKLPARTGGSNLQHARALGGPASLIHVRNSAAAHRALPRL